MPRDHEDREQGAASTNQGTPRMPANRQEPGEQRGTDSPTQACKGANPANTWTLDSSLRKLLMAKPPGVWHIVTAALRR